MVTLKGFLSCLVLWLSLYKSLFTWNQVSWTKVQAMKILMLVLTLTTDLSGLREAIGHFWTSVSCDISLRWCCPSFQL